MIFLNRMFEYKAIFCAKLRACVLNKHKAGADLDVGRVLWRT